MKKTLDFKRSITEEILKNIGSSKVLLIFGPRQSGKTTLAKHILATYSAPSAYFNCEELSVSQHFSRSLFTTRLTHAL